MSPSGLPWIVAERVSVSMIDESLTASATQPDEACPPWRDIGLHPNYFDSAAAGSPFSLAA